MKGVFFLINAAVPEKPIAGISFGLTTPVLPRPYVHKHALRTGFPLHRAISGIILLIITCLTLSSCATLTKRNPVPEQYVQEANIHGIQFARFWGDEIPHDLKERLAKAKEQIEALNLDATWETIDYLAFSGGGANGAFGAGLMVGWTEAGDRPEFRIVTGISTGALIAPFAFLGPKQDALLKKFFTTTSTKDVITKRPLLTILTGESVINSDPLRQTLREIFDEKMIAAIAAEHAGGRRLYIGTTNLDAGRPVIWNIGAIAVSGHPRSAELISDVLLASASIPGVFPPVFIEVKAGGKSYEEIHVDGGTSSQVFLYPLSLDIGEVGKAVGVEGETRMFVIRNSQLIPHWKVVNPKLAEIAGRSLSTLIRTQGIGDLYRIYLGAQRDGIEYNLAFIPEDFKMESKEAFDTEYMSRLFDLGYQMAKSGYPWKKAPIGFEPP